MAQHKITLLPGDVILSGTPANQVSQYQRQLDAAMKAAAQHTADQAASAGEDGSR